MVKACLPGAALDNTESSNVDSCVLLTMLSELISNFTNVSLSCHLLQVSSSGVFELKLHHLLNDDGLNADGNCCNGIRQSGSCSSTCHTFFRICLKHYQTNITPEPPCTFGELTTKIIGDNTFDFPDETPNPIKLPFTFGWPVSKVTRHM